MGMEFKSLNLYKNKAAAIKQISVINGLYKEGIVLPN
jgi:hypothetical protein